MKAEFVLFLTLVLFAVIAYWATKVEGSPFTRAPDLGPPKGIVKLGLLEGIGDVYVYESEMLTCVIIPGNVSCL